MALEMSHCQVLVLHVTFIFTLIVIISSSANGTNKIKESEKFKPRNVSVDVINETSIQLRWDPPKEAELDQCPVQRFTIRLKTEGAKRSRTWKIDGSRRSVTLHDLIVGNTYYVRLVAFVCDGKGKPSRWMRVQTSSDHNPSTTDMKTDSRELQVPSKPTYVRTRTFSDSVIVSWLPPEDDTVVRGYMVGYGEGVPDVNWQYVEAERKNVTIKNLKAATQYIVSVRAFNNFGKGPVVYDLIYTREQSAGTTVGPASSPTDLRAKILSPTTAWLQWNDPSLGRHQQLTDTRYYNVHYQPISTGKTLSVIVKAFHVVLYDLLPGTRYEFKVRMVKDAQASPFSEPLVNKTFETAPSSPPRSLSVQPTNTSDSVLVSWRPPRLPNGDITGYLVLYTHEADQPTDKWHVQSVPGQELSSIVSGMKPNKTYNFRVQGRNSNGYSPMSSANIYYTKIQSQTDVNFDPASSVSGSVSSENPQASNTMNQGVNSSVTATGKVKGDRDVPEDDEEEKTTDAEPKEDDEDDDEYDVDREDAEDGEDNFESAALVSEAIADADGKSKRQPTGSERSASVASGPTHLSDIPRTASLDTPFRSVVRHQVSAYITWPDTLTRCGDGLGSSTQSTASSSSSQSAAPPVVVSGYLFRCARQNQRGGKEKKLTRNLTTNFILLDDLLPNSVYRYQVRYLFSDGTQSSWIGEGTIDTHYPQIL